MNEVSKAQLDRMAGIHTVNQTKKSRKMRKSRFENPEDYSQIPNLNNAISNFEEDAKVLVNFFNGNTIDTSEIIDRISECRTDLDQIESGLSDLEYFADNGYGASTKKSQWTKDKSNVNKIAPVVAGALASVAGNVVSNMVSDKLSESNIPDTGSESHDQIKEADDIALSENDMIRKPDDIALGCDKCGDRTRKAEMPDADEQQNVKDGESSNKDELPEDADEQQEENQGKASNKDELPEDADDQEDVKQAQARKFSVTCRGSEKYDGRENYNQSPMMREGIDRSQMNKSELVDSLNARLGEINKAKRNKSNTSIPMHINNY